MTEPMLNLLEIVLKLFLATLFAGIVGLEREIHGRAAGLRTHILVSLGSCLIMLISIRMFEIYGAATDPGRIASNVVTGIGFLGAGTILRYRTSVIGLTTAASIWTVAAVGLAVGAGFYYESIVTTLFAFLTLVVVSKFESLVLGKFRYKSLVIEGNIDLSVVDKIRNVMFVYKAELINSEIEKLVEQNESRLVLDIKLTTNKYDDNIILEALKIDGVRKAHW